MPGKMQCRQADSCAVRDCLKTRAAAEISRVWKSNTAGPGAKITGTDCLSAAQACYCRLHTATA